MKKFLLFLTVLLGLTLSAQADEYTYEFLEKIYSANGTVALGDVNWTLAGDGAYWGYDGTKGQQFGSGSNPYTSLKLSTSDIVGTISKITLNTSGASSIKATATVSVGGTQYGESISLTTTATDYTFQGSASGEIVISYTQTSKKAIYIKSITVEYTANNNERLAAPAITSSCNFLEKMNVEISANSGTIMYSNGGDYQEYTTPIEISETTTIKTYAKATEAGYADSETVSATYTKVLPQITESQSYSGTIDVTISCEEFPDAVIYYTTNGDVPTASSSVYDKANGLTLTGAEDITVKAIAVYDGQTSDAVEATYTYYDPSDVIQWQLVTETPDSWEGDYLIVYNGEYAFDSSRSTIDAANNYQEVSASNGVITTDPNCNFYFTVESNGSDAYLIKTPDNRYIYNSSNSNGLYATTNVETANKAPISFTASENETTIKTSAGAELRYNSASDQNRFRFYKSTSASNQKAVQMYKKVAGEITVTPDVPTVEGVTTGSVYTSVPTITITAPEKNAEGILYSLSYTGANEESNTWEINEAVQSVELTSESLSGYGQFGTYALTAWTINGDEASKFVEISFEIVDNTCATIADFKAFAQAYDGVEAKLTGDVTVTNHSGAFLFVQDNTGALCIWGSYLNDKATPYQNGDVLSGDKIGTAEYSTSEPICMKEPASLPEATVGTAVEPLDMTDVISTDYFEEYENQYITLKNVTIDSANQKLVLADETPIPYANTLSITMPEDETLIYNVIGIYYCVSGKLRIYPISFEALPSLEAPTFSVNGETVTGGEFTDPFELTISAAEGATIYYSLNSGEWTEYTTAITISTVTTIEAYAAQDGYNNSEIVKIKYTIPYEEVDGVLNFVEYFADESHWTAPEENCKWWTQSYQSRQVKFETNGATVDFSSASHQVLTTSITDCPVIKAGTVTVSFTNTNSCFTYIDFQLKQWSDKEISKKTPAVSYTLDGIEWVDIASTQEASTRSAATGEIATYAATDTYNITNVKVEEFPEGVKQVRLTLTNDDQVGLELINYKKYDIPTSVEGVEVDENAPVEYYNFQGVRVVNPEKGMYIRVQGGKATKVIIR